MNLPHAEPGNRVGLFGGSFNPPHSGHRLVAETAMRRLGLDQVWWLVTPGNPLKDHAELAPLARRIALTAATANHPRMRVTAFEAVLGTSYTASTLAGILQRRPDLSFCWIMGADNLAGFHRWQNWRDIVRAVPIAIVDRPGASLSPLFAPMAQAFGMARVPEPEAATLMQRRAPAWVFLHTPLDAASSTALRRKAARA
ncbi:nicotinate-nucleotide adenylyltransferase [Microvirga tunisiensis]|uniref:Nicotinate-nucleotide adenylyltransferase n=3 Tax=Pannonibacter tanglangensis TaxID=2750084 RepID=A0ABW9ZJ56_9HYPH|nr:nicotinate-nucleotide adenylyltransferase [Pannonibacter sp. XCT-34]NBN79420.1 nicotinate-nucleotide adenylyltransferase [Pannonibacter sp. XCT-53]